MDYLNIKQDFLNHLKKNNINTELYTTKEDNNENIKVNIFEKTEEFKDYITNVLEIDAENQNLLISDLMRLEIKEGKFIEKDEQKTDDVKAEKSEGNKLIKFLNSLLSDKEIIEKLDSDKSGDLNKEEIQEFVENINAIEEIFDCIIKIAKGEYNKEEETKVNSLNEAYVNENTMIPEGNSWRPVYTNYNNYNPTSYAKATGNEITEKKDVTNMSKAELETEREKVQTTITDKKKELDEVNNDTAPDVKSLKDAMEENYKLYHDKLEKIAPELAKMLEDLTKKETDAQKAYDDKQKDFDVAVETLNDSENNLKIAQSTLESFETRLAQLNSIDTSKYSGEKLAEFNDKKTKLQAEIAIKKQAVTDATAARDKALEAKNKIETEELPKLKENLENAKKNKEECETKIQEQKPEIKELQEKYLQSKDAYENKKSEMIAKIQEEIKFSQNKIQKLDVELAKRKNWEDLSQYTSVYYSPELIAKLETNHKVKVSEINGEMFLQYGWARYGNVRPELNEGLRKLEEFALANGYVIVRSDGARTFAESAAGRAKKGNIVCAPGKSPHNYGAGADLTIFDSNGKQYTFDKLPEIYQYAEQHCGLKWGGHFKGSRGAKERHHFELFDWRSKYKKDEYRCG